MELYLELFLILRLSSNPLKISVVNASFQPEHIQWQCPGPAIQLGGLGITTPVKHAEPAPYFPKGNSTPCQ